MTTVHVRHSSAPAPGAGVDLVWSAGGRVQTWLDELANGAAVTPSDAIRDLMVFAVSAYTADKAVLRDGAADRWTRSIELHVPLIQPARWPIVPSERLLHRLTGDNWTVIPEQTVAPLVSWPTGQSAAVDSSPDEVALISGGLDSLSYLAEVVQQKRPVDFIAHYDPNARKSLQRDLFASVSGDTASARLRQFKVQLVGLDPLLGDLKENTTRARAVIFFAGATAAAHIIGARAVSIPENGFVSINVPLGPNRIGSLSTRTTHPLTIEMYQDLVDALGITVVLRMPYEYLTKGEVVSRGRIAGLIPEVIAATVSCAHPLQGRWRQAGYGNCGYCYACLIRRSALEASGDDPTAYQVDPRTVTGVTIGNDFRAVVTTLSRPLRRGAIVSAGPLPTTYDAVSGFETLQRGYRELRNMIERGLTPDVRARIGW